MTYKLTYKIYELTYEIYEPTYETYELTNELLTNKYIEELRF